MSVFENDWIMRQIEGMTDTGQGAFTSGEK